MEESNLFSRSDWDKKLCSYVHWYDQAVPGCADICLETSQSQRHRSESLPEEQTSESSLPGTLKAADLVLRSLSLCFCLGTSPASVSLKTCSRDLPKLSCLHKAAVCHLLFLQSSLGLWMCCLGGSCKPPSVPMRKQNIRRHLLLWRQKQPCSRHRSLKTPHRAQGSD